MSEPLFYTGQRGFTLAVVIKRDGVALDFSHPVLDGNYFDVMICDEIGENFYSQELVFYTDGSDGKLKCFIQNPIFNHTGIWNIQTRAYLEGESRADYNILYSEILPVHVGERIDVINE